MRQIIDLRYICIVLTVLLWWQPGVCHDKGKIDLSGEWNVDLSGEGKDGKIMLPGTLDMAGYGVEVDTLALSRDEQFRRLTRRHSYVGPATYSRNVVIPGEMAGKPLELMLERVIWGSKASIGGKPFDNEAESLVASHRHILREGLPAGEYPLEIVVDNSRRYDISTGDLAHCYTNDTQTIWNGILGEISLRAIPQSDLSRVEIYPSDSLDSLRIDAYVVNSTSKQRKEKISFSIGDVRKTIKENLRQGENKISVVLPVKGIEKWNEFNPVMNKVSVTVGKESEDYSFGLRSVDNKDGLRVNGIPVFLRGTLECCVFPLTGTPPTDREGWVNTFGKAKEWGLNHLRFHSWCPPEAAFQVADSLGFYLQVELPVWSLKIGDDATAESFLRDEFERIVENYGNHPSLCLLSVGNELKHDFDWLNETVALMKKRDPRRLYTTTSFTFEKGHGGHPEPEDQFFVTQWTDKGWVRGQGVFETECPAFNKNYESSLDGIGVPLISHEIGQYAVYPHMSEIEKYTGVLNPLNFKNIRHDLQEKGLISESGAMTMASCHLAAILYKEEIERALKTKGMSGFQLLGLQDFPGQGTALVGLADAFWDNKGAVSEEWFREFCSPVVPLLNFDKAVYGADENFEGEINIVNFTDESIPGGEMEWSLTIEDNGQVIASGKVDYPEIMAGSDGNAGGFSALLKDMLRPGAVIARLTMPDGRSNSWRIHVYPDAVQAPGKAVVTRSPSEALRALSEGRDVLLAPSPDSIRGLESKFLPVFWSPVHFPKQAGTMGIMCDPGHPALSGFPNNGHSDWQWWTSVRNAKVVDMDSVPGGEAIVKVIDNFVNNRRLAYLFEAKCGKGRLLFSAIDLLNSDLDTPDIKAFKASLVNYINSTSFNPSGIITEESLSRLTHPAHKSVKSAVTSIYE